MAKSESRTSLLKAAGSRRAAGAQPRGSRARDGRGRGGPAGREQSQEPFPEEPSARRPLCHPSAWEDGARGAGKLSHGRGESQPEPAEGGPSRGSGKEPVRTSRHHHHLPPHASHGHPQDQHQLSDRDGEEAEEDFFFSHRQRSSRESLKLSEGASPLSKSSSKYSTKSSGSDRSVEADPLFDQLHPMLSSVFGQVRSQVPLAPSLPPSLPALCALSSCPLTDVGLPVAEPQAQPAAVNALLPDRPCRTSPGAVAPPGRCGAGTQEGSAPGRGRGPGRGRLWPPAAPPGAAEGALGGAGGGRAGAFPAAGGSCGSAC